MFLKIDIEYWFWLEDNLGGYYQTKMEWLYRQWIHMNHFVEWMNNLNNMQKN